MTGRFTAGGSEDTRACYRKANEYDYQSNSEPEELQFQTTPGPERVVRSAKQTGSLSFDLEQNDYHQEDRDEYLDDVENRHFLADPEVQVKIALHSTGLQFNAAASSTIGCPT